MDSPLGAANYISLLQGAASLKMLWNTGLYLFLCSERMQHRSTTVAWLTGAH